MTELTDEEILRDLDLMRGDTNMYIQRVSDFIRQNPDSPDGYFRRYQAWEHLGRPDLALEDITRSLELEEHWVVFQARGCVYRQLGDYQSALRDYNRAAQLDREDWLHSPGPLFRADCHAHLGDEAAALADCALLRNDHWTPGLSGAPAGSKAEVIEAVRYIAAVARQRQQGG